MANRGTLRLLAQLRNEIAGVTDTQTRDLVTAYATSWDEIASELDATINDLMAQAVDGRVSQSKARKSKRLRESLAVITERLRTLAADAEVRIVGDLDAAIRIAGELETEMIRAQLPAGTAELVTGFDRVDDAAIHSIIERSTQQIHARTAPLSRDAVAAMRRELVRGVTVGANPRETASRMLARTQGIFEGGAVRANRIARTETLDAMREASRIADRANSTVTGWQWITELSARTCAACLAMHGSTHRVEDPGPLGHQNCRCTRAPLTKSWADLGFEDIEEPPDILPDAQTFFDGLTLEQQKGILGADGLAAYQAGIYPMGSWATLRSTDGWRDSYVPSKPPKLSPRLAS